MCFVQFLSVVQSECNASASWGASPAVTVVQTMSTASIASAIREKFARSFVTVGLLSPVSISYV